MAIRKAVIPAAGLGTRFLPATKAQPKEMIPVIDKPGIQYTVEEAHRAGIRDIVVITSSGKTTMEDHFDRDAELEELLEAKGKTEELEAIKAVSELANIHYVMQEEATGLGPAVLLAKEHVGNESFAGMLPDEIIPEPIPGETALLPRLIELHEETGASVVAVRRVGREDVSKYGVIEHEEIKGDFTRVVRLVEKPSPEEAPSDLGLPGRYVFTPDIFDAIERTGPGAGGEVQLTDAIDLLAKEGTVYAYIHEGPTFDYGKKLEFLKSTVQLALRRDDLSKPFKEFLRELDLGD